MPVIHREHYDSAADWYDHVERLSKQRDFPGVSSDTTLGVDYRTSFTGSSSFPDALRMARDGWPEGREFMSDRLEASVNITRNTTYKARGFDVAGAYPDIARAIAGAPDCMTTILDEERATRPIIRLVCEQWGSAGVGTKELTQRGAAILAHVDRLESMGAQIEIVARFSCSQTPQSKRDKNCIVDVMGKRAGEPLEVDRLAFLLAHPSALRRFFFRQLETFPNDIYKEFHFMCGRPPTKCAREVAPGEVFIPSANENTSQYRSVETATAHIGDIIRTGIENNTDCRSDFFNLAA